MPIRASYIADEFRLDLSFSGNLDVSVSQDICHVCNSVPAGLRSCIIDLCGIDRLFDSGVALLKMLHRRLTQRNVIVVILSNSTEIRERIPTIASRPSPFFSPKGPAPSHINPSAEARPKFS